jgi:hypothetical protein
MDTDRIDQSFAAKQNMVERTLVRPTGAPQRQQSKVPPPRPPRQPWKAAVSAQNDPRLPGNEYDTIPANEYDTIPANEYDTIPASDEFATQQTSGEYDKLPSRGEFDKPSASNPYDKLPTNAEYEAMRANGAQVKSSNPYDKLPTNAEYEAMRANEPRHEKLPTKSELDAYANRAQVKSSNPYDKLPTNAEYEAMRANGAQVKPSNPYGKLPTNVEYEAIRGNGAQVKPSNPYGKLPTKSELDARANGAQRKPANPYGKLPTKSELDARANGLQAKDANAPQAKENPYGRPIKVDPSKYGASPKSSPKSVEVETPLPKAQNTRQRVQLPETGHVAKGQFVLATDSLLIQKNEKDHLVHYDSDHFSRDARKIIAESVSNQEPVHVTTENNELKVAKVQKL